MRSGPERVGCRGRRGGTAVVVGRGIILIVIFNINPATKSDKTDTGGTITANVIFARQSQTFNENYS
jgi:hypothetical protein